MFQDLKVFKCMTVYENPVVASGCRVGGWSRRKTEQRAAGLIDQTLERLGLARHANRLTRDLPYAERKLVALSRTICSGGKILLLDEAASGMDKASLKLVLDTECPRYRDVAAQPGRYHRDRRAQPVDRAGAGLVRPAAGGRQDHRQRRTGRALPKLQFRAGPLLPAAVTVERRPAGRPRPPSLEQQQWFLVDATSPGIRIDPS